MTGSPARIALQMARIKAVEGYAEVEQSLCSIFAGLLQTSDDRAAIVFFKIVNTSARNSILKDLLKKRHGEMFDRYWYGIPNTPNNKGMFSLISHLGEVRNQIVHWSMVQVMGSHGESWTLHKPNFWEITHESPSISEPDLQLFSAKADFASRSLNMFDLVVHRLPSMPEGTSSQADLEKWNEILHQPCVYPPPADHPMNPKN